MRPGSGAGVPEAPTEGGKIARRPITAHAVLLRRAIFARSFAVFLARPAILGPKEDRSKQPARLFCYTAVLCVTKDRTRKKTLV